MDFGFPSRRHHTQSYLLSRTAGWHESFLSRMQLPRSNKACPSCSHEEAVFFQSQQRSAETGMVSFAPNPFAVPNPWLTHWPEIILRLLRMRSYLHVTYSPIEMSESSEKAISKYPMGHAMRRRIYYSHSWKALLEFGGLFLHMFCFSSSLNYWIILLLFITRYAGVCQCFIGNKVAMLCDNLERKNCTHS